MTNLPGLLLTIALALIALILGHFFPILGAPVAGILIGIAVRNLIGVKDVFTPGLKIASKQLLQWCIVGLGFGLSIQQVAQTGVDSFYVTLITIFAAFASAYVLGKILGIEKNLKILIGVGTAICGGSAIAATTPIIKPKDHDVSYAISTIFIFNIAAVLIFPVVGHWLEMSDIGFGTWAGTAINDTSSVVAAAYSYSTEAGDYATIVKLTRATLIIPICIGLIFIQILQNKKENSSLNIKQIFPWFILWFVVASIIKSLNFIPEFLIVPLRLTSEFLIVVALTAIGLSSNLKMMLTAGIKPVLLGLGVWASVVFSSLAVQYLVGNW